MTIGETKLAGAKVHCVIDATTEWTGELVSAVSARPNDGPTACTLACFATCAVSHYQSEIGRRFHQRYSTCRPQRHPAAAMGWRPIQQKCLRVDAVNIDDVEGAGTG